MGKLTTPRAARRAIVEIAARQEAAAPGNAGFHRFQVLVLLRNGFIWHSAFYARSAPTVGQIAARLVNEPGSWRKHSEQTPNTPEK